MFEMLGTDALSEKEIKGGEFAIGAALYQYGADLDAKFLCLLWAASISAPRLAQMAMQRQEKAKQAATEVNRAMRQASEGGQGRLPMQNPKDAA